MTLVAVNLPSIWLLVSRHSSVPEKVLHSLRSLTSLRSGGSNDSSRRRSRKSGDNNDGSSSQNRMSEDKARLTNKILPDSGGEYEAYVMGNVAGDLESGKGAVEDHVPPVPPIGGILVKDTVTQSTRQP